MGRPVRIVARAGAKTNLIIKGAEFCYNTGNQNVGNGDVLIGDGRYDAPKNQGTVTLQMTGTDADVVVQKGKVLRCGGQSDRSAEGPDDGGFAKRDAGGE